MESRMILRGKPAAPKTASVPDLVDPTSTRGAAAIADAMGRAFRRKPDRFANPIQDYLDPLLLETVKRHIVKRAAEAEAEAQRVRRASRKPSKLTDQARRRIDSVLVEILRDWKATQGRPPLTRAALLDAAKLDPRAAELGNWSISTFRAALFGRQRGSGTRSTSIFPCAKVKWDERRPV